MRMTIRQYSDLIEGDVVAERECSADDPGNVIDVLTLVLRNCSDFIRQEEIALLQDAIELKRMEFTYPGVAGRLEVVFPDQET